MTVIFNLHVFSCIFMTGLIWLIQLVHYPSFRFVNPKRFSEFHEFHSRRITWIVLPIMALELTTAICLVYKSPTMLWTLNLAGVVLIWLATAFLSVPSHARLGREGTANEMARLVRTNWIRTLIWSARTTVLFALVVE